MDWFGHERAGEACGGAGSPSLQGEGQGGADIKRRAEVQDVRYFSAMAQ